MTQAIARAYEDFAYPSQAFPEMHPGKLSVMASLFGMQPAHPARCRMLELGCGGGGSLIPFAYGLPQSTFLGIDITQSAIEGAQASAQRMDLRNVEFCCQDILEIPESIGTFDYITAHGVYSWVPAQVREKMLDICRRHLAPNGVAYISYNARPGSDLRNLLRQIMLFHTQGADSPQERIRQARAVTEFLANAKGGNEIFNRVMEWNRERISRLPDAMVFHDDLGTFNDAFFFHEFVRQAAAHGLQYLGESDLYSMNERRFDPAVREQIAQIGGNILSAEQYMDFLAGRSFRETLLCHAEASLDRQVTEERISGMFFASQLEPTSPSPSIASAVPEEFRATKDRAVRTDHPVAKAILFSLYKAYPNCLTFDELHARVCEHLGAVEPKAVAGALLEMYATGPAIEITTVPTPCARHLSERPRLSALARMQLEMGAPTVTNLRCHVLEMTEPLTRDLLLLLDGTRDRRSLADEIVSGVLSGRLPQPPGGAGDEPSARKLIEEGIEPNLEKAYRYAVLVE